MNEGNRLIERLVVRTPTPPAFKNTKRSILDRNTGKQRTLTPGPIKKRMDVLENAILSALYSSCLTEGGEMHLECLKQLRTALCDLLDDSCAVIPQGSWGVEYAELPELEGLIILIEEIQ